jgi:hypothetical protein
MQRKTLNFGTTVTDESILSNDSDVMLQIG